MFRVGLNPYGLAYTVGLQGAGTARANPQAIGLKGFIALAREMRAQCIELDWRWISPMDRGDLGRLRNDLAGMTPICSHWLVQKPGETLAEAIRCASALDAPLVRLHLTPVLEGARAAWGTRWSEMVAHARAIIKEEAPKAAAAGLMLAIEDHQDLGSEELVALAEEAGDNVGVALDTGNPFAVAEDPVAFTQRVAERIRHVHLKDYIAQFTRDGYRLVRCAVGEGCVPFQEIADVLRGLPSLTASLEIGALDVRHIKVFTSAWWNGYVPREASELETALARLRRNALPDDADYRTPWERQEPGAAVMAYELDQMRRSFDNVRAMGWI